MTSMAEMRKFQQDYLRAEEELRWLDREMLAVEERYIRENGIVNEDDGTIPHGILNIHDDDAFIEADARCSEIADEIGLSAKLRQAADALNAAGDALIAGTVELLPDRFCKEKENLLAGAKNSVKIRGKLISRGMALDTGLEKEMEAAQEIADVTGLEF